jgi:rhodanese-related sulfurtransferase
MAFIVENWYLIFAALASGTLLAWPYFKPGAGQGVDTNEAVRLINREKGVLIDVSEATEFAAGHAGGARHVPLTQIESGSTEAKALPSNKTLPLLLICPTGARAGRAAAALRKAGYEKAVAVKGGTSAWRAASLPVEKSA